MFMVFNKLYVMCKFPQMNKQLKYFCIKNLTLWQILYGIYFLRRTLDILDDPEIVSSLQNFDFATLLIDKAHAKRIQYLLRGRTVLKTQP